MKDARGVLISDKLAREGGYTTGASMEVTSPSGLIPLSVRGSFRDQRFARVFQGDVALMDTPRAQALFGKEQRYDWIQVASGPDADLAALETALQGAVQGYAQVTSPRTRGKRVESMLRSNRWMLSLSSLFAAAVGLFLVAQSMYTSTEQRGVEYSTLRCLGATRGQLVSVVLFEAALLGLAGSVVGVAAGLAFCKLALGPFGIFVSTTYIQMKPAELVLSPARSHCVVRHRLRGDARRSARSGCVGDLRSADRSLATRASPVAPARAALLVARALLVRARRGASVAAAAARVVRGPGGASVCPSSCSS
jgi:putative ABC transport system permease protein